MKKTLILISALCMCSLGALSQKIKITDLDKCLSLGTSGQMSQIITPKGWCFYKQEPWEDDSQFGSMRQMTWAYWDDINDRYSDKANAWMYAYIAQKSKGKIVSIEYHCFNTEDYAYFAESLESSNYSFVRTTEYDEFGFKKDTYIRSIYQNPKNILWVESYKDETEVEDREWVDGHWSGGYDMEYDYYSGQYKKVWNSKKDYISGYYRTVKKKKAFTRWIISISPRGGKLDKSNGHKEVYWKGKLLGEYELKNDYLVGEMKNYFANGKIYDIMHINKTPWIIEKFNYKGEKVSSLTVQNKGLQKIEVWENYYLHASGSYVSYKDEYLRHFDLSYRAPRVETKYEGNFTVRLFLYGGGNIDVTIADTLNENDKYTITEYKYDKNGAIETKTISKFNKGEEIESLVYDNKNRLIEKTIYSGDKTENQVLEYEGDNLISKRITLYNDKEEEYSIYNGKNKLIEKYQRLDDLLQGEYIKREYADNGSLLKEQKKMYKKGRLDGESVTTSYLPNGVKVVEVDNFLDGEYDGYCYQESYINGKRQLDKYGTYLKGKLNGKCLDISGDSVIYGICKDGETEHLRLFRDDMMRFRSPQYILTDTSKLTLITDASFNNGELTKISSYYPGYFADTIKMIKGKHAGELQYTIDYEKGVHTIYADFGIEYIDSTYESYFLEVHIDPITHKNNGLTTYKDSLGNYIHITNYKNGLLDGWSKYFQIPYCEGEFMAEFKNGVWLRTKYKPRGGDFIEIQRISLSQVCVLTYTDEQKLARKDYFIVNSKTISGFNDERWVNIFKAKDTYKTGEFYVYDKDERVVTYRKKDSNFIVNNDYDQQITYYVHNANAVPEKYYKLDTQEFFSGTYSRDLGVTTEIIKVKNGYRDGVTKVVDNNTGKTIKKIKYTKGLAK